MKRAAMMIHGFLTDKNDFGELPKVLQGRYDEIFLCEIPGHDGSGDYSKWTVDNTIEYVEKVFADLQEKYDELDVYGFSMGGALATHLASRGGVKNLVLFAPANKYINGSYLASGFALYYKTIKKTVERSSMENMIKDVEEALEVYLQNSKISMDMAVKRLIPYYSRHTLTTFSRLIRKINSGLVPWEAKTCLFWGKLDQLVPQSTVDFLSDFFVDTEHYVKIYDDVSHLMLQSANAEKICIDVEKFLDGKEEFQKNGKLAKHQRKTPKIGYRKSKESFEEILERLKAHKKEK